MLHSTQVTKPAGGIGYDDLQPLYQRRSCQQRRAEVSNPGQRPPPQGPANGNAKVHTSEDKQTHGVIQQGERIGVIEVTLGGAHAGHEANETAQ